MSPACLAFSANAMVAAVATAQLVLSADTPRLTDPQALQDFDTGGYRYRPEMSQPDKPVFLRDYPSA